MISERLIIEGFLSYKARQTIDFPVTPICLVNGSINSDPTLSNGAGKSSLFEAISVNLFGKIGGRGDRLDDYINQDMDSMYVEHIFKIDGQRYRCVFSRNRSSSTLWQLYYDTTNSDIDSAEWKITDTKIEDVLGLGFITFNSTIYLNERDALKFIDGESSDRKEILRELLNIKIFETAAKQAGNLLSEIEKKIEINKNLIENKQQQIVDENEVKSSIETIKVSVKKLKDEIAKENEKIKVFEKDQKILEAKIEKQKAIEDKIKSENELVLDTEKEISIKQTKISTLESKIANYVSSISSNKSGAEKRKGEKELLVLNLEKEKEAFGSFKDYDTLIQEENKKIEEQNKTIREKEKQISSLQEELKQINSLLQKIKEFGNVCPVSEEPCSIINSKFRDDFKSSKEEKNSKTFILLTTAKSELEKLEERLGLFKTNQQQYLQKNKEKSIANESIKSKESDIKALDLKISNLQENNKEYEKLLLEYKSEKEALTKEISQHKDKLAERKNKVTELEKQIDKRLNNELVLLNRQIDVLKNLIKEKELQIGENNKIEAIQINKLEQNKQYREHIKKLMDVNEQLTKKEHIYTTLISIFGKEGIQKVIMKRVVPFLEESASELLKVFNNDSEKIKIKFDLDPKRADGELKKTGGLDILVVEEGYPPKDLRMYSGGERIRLIFSIILGLSRLLAKRSGKKHETLIIDEKIAKLDRKGIEQFAEVINIISNWYRRIFIITHIESLKDIFNDGEILVNKTEEDGSIVIVK